jgi:hypothetical protein
MMLDSFKEIVFLSSGAQFFLLFFHKTYTVQKITYFSTKLIKKLKLELPLVVLYITISIF